MAKESFDQACKDLVNQVLVKHVIHFPVRCEFRDTREGTGSGEFLHRLEFAITDNKTEADEGARSRLRKDTLTLEDDADLAGEYARNIATWLNTEYSISMAKAHYGVRQVSHNVVVIDATHD